MLDQNKRSSILKIENSSKRNGKRHLIVTNEGSYKGDWKNDLKHGKNKSQRSKILFLFACSY